MQAIFSAKKSNFCETDSNETAATGTSSDANSLIRTPSELKICESRIQYEVNIITKQFCYLEICNLIFFPKISRPRFWPKKELLT